MGVAGEHMDGSNVIAADFPFEDFAFGVVQVALLDKAVAGDDDELFPFGVVPVLALGDARFRYVDTHLAGVEGVDQFGKGAARVDVHLQWEGGLLVGQVAQVSAVELLGETICRYLRNHERLRLFRKTTDQINDLSQLNIVNDWNLAIIAIMVLFPLERRNQFIHDIVNIHQMHHYIRIVHQNGKIVGDIVTESGYGTVIIRPAPFSENIRKTIDENLRPSLFRVFKKQLLASPLTFAVKIVQSRLDGAAEHDGTTVAVLFQGVQQCRSKTEVASHEFFLVLRAVDPGEIEDEVAVATPGVKVFGGTIEVVFVNGLDDQALMGPVFSVLYVLQRPTEVLPYEAFGAGD